MAIDFPNSPALNDYFESNDKAWTFNGTSWDIVQTPANLSIANASITGAKLASGAAVTNIGYTPANIASPTFTGTVAGITKSMVGLGSVDNTADTAKPVSTAQQTALDLKAPLAGPTFTGTVTLPSTTSIGTVSSTEIGYVDGVTSSIQTQLDSKLTATTAVTSNRNAFINGAMNVWQRGTTSGTLGLGGGSYVGPDRWWFYNNGFTTTISRQPCGSTLPQFQYCARIQRTAGQTSIVSSVFFSPLETANSVRFAGKNATLSFYARASSGISSATSLGVNVFTGTGTDQSNFGGSAYTGLTNAGGIGPTLTTSWQRFSVTCAIAATATEIGIQIGFIPVGTAGASDYFEITGIQLEEGSVATPFEFEDFGTTLRKCQRYFEKSYNIETTPGTASTLNESIGLGIYTNTPAAYNRFGSGVFFKVPKRATPTVVQYAPATGSTAAASNVTNGDGSTAVGYVSAQQINQNGFNLAASVGGSTSTGYFTIFIAYTASAEL